MIFTVIALLIITAFVVTIASATTPRCPLWVAVLLLCLVELIRIFPSGK